MVKGRCSSSSSDQRSACPPLASLSLASTHLKPSRPSPLFTLLKRSPLAGHTEPDMEPPSPCSSSPPLNLLEVEAHASHPLKEESTAERDAMGVASRRYPNKAAETLSSADEESDDDGQEKDTQVVMCGRQRLQQHRIQMSGKVVIPDTWGREQQLQDWVSYGIVEDSLRPAGLMTARTALVIECQRTGNKPVRTSPAMSADVEVS